MMALPSEFLIAMMCVLTVLYLWKTSRPSGKRKLPGPWKLPLLGNILQLGRRPHETFLNWSKIYGPIFKVKFGTMDAVVINDCKMTKELLNNSASTGRTTDDNPVVYAFTQGIYGIFNSEGATWEQQRRFTIRTLKDFGFSNTSMEGLILDEARAVVNWLRQSNGKPLCGKRMFNAPVLNSLWRIVDGERVEWENGRPTILDVTIDLSNAINTVTNSGLLFAPVLRFIAPGFFGWTSYLNAIKNMSDLITDSIKQHRKTFNAERLRDFIDHHLLEIENTTDPDSSFYKDRGEMNLIAVVFDLFIAGSETTANTLSWSLYYLSHYQDIQRRIQGEIDQIVGSAEPSVSKKPEMPYTEAVTFEIMRFSSLVSFVLPHKILADTNFHGYDLPKGTAVIANLYGIHHDPAVWGDPEIFRPDRFLSADGKSVIRHDAWIPFAEGKRKCIGETLARNTLFLFVVSIFQNFNVHFSDENFIPDFESEMGFFLVPKPFNISMLPRNNDVCKLKK